MFKILGAKNRRKNLHKHPGPPFQIRGGPGSFSNAQNPNHNLEVGRNPGDVCCCFAVSYYPFQ